MCLCQITCVASLIRRRFVASSWATAVRGNGGNVATLRCYTSRNVVFDEASSWWSPQKVELPNYEDLENHLHEELGEIREREESHDSTQEPTPTTGDGEQRPSLPSTLEKPMSPWQTGVDPSSPEEV